MFRQSPSRTQRSRGIKVKHVIQICFLVAICFWLLYQVKHSHDKKKEFHEGDVKISQHTQGGGEIVKLGRKDLIPRVEDTTTSTRSQDEEAEEENAGEEEEIKLEEENAEDKKSEEKDDERGGVEDNEIDEHEEDKSDAEGDREVDVIEEEKENEEKDSEDNDGGQLDIESSMDEHDDDEQAHEAREELYKADDASSAVTHEIDETEVVDAENDNGNMKKSNELAETNIVANEQVVNDTNENTAGKQAANSKVEDQKMTEEGDSIKTTDNKDMENVGSKPDDSSDDHIKLFNNTTEASSVNYSLSARNGTEKESDFNLAENVTTQGTTSDDGSGLHTIAPGLGSNSSLSSTENQADSNITASTKVEDADLNSREVSKTDNGTLSIIPEQLIESSNEAEGKKSEDSSNDGTDGASDGASELENPAEGTKSEDSSNDGTEEASDGASETENQEEVQHDLIDTSDSSIGLEEKEVRTDLETLPEIQTEGSNDEDAAAE